MGLASCTFVFESTSHRLRFDKKCEPDHKAPPFWTFRQLPQAAFTKLQKQILSQECLHSLSLLPPAALAQISSARLASRFQFK